MGSDWLVYDEWGDEQPPLHYPDEEHRQTYFQLRAALSAWSLDDPSSRFAGYDDLDEEAE